MRKLPLKPRRPRPKVAYIGANIKAAREASGLSQLELAHKAGWHGDDAGAQLCRIEKGQTQPRFTTLIKLAKVLKVRVEDLVTEKKKINTEDY